MPKKRSRKQQNRKNWFNKIISGVSLTTILLILGFVTLGVMFFQEQEKQLTVNAVLDNPDATKQQLTPAVIDFPNKEMGTFSGFAGEKFFKEPIDKVVILFASAKIPGLAIIYYPEEKKIMAGLPQMVIENVELFNGAKHQIAYTFKNDGKQRFYYDGNLKLETDFKILETNKATGMSVLKKNKVILSEGLEAVEIN